MNTDYLAILPEIGLVILAAVLLAVDVLKTKERKGLLAWLTFGGLAIIFGLAIFTRPDHDELIWFGMLRDDMFAFVFRMIFLIGAAVTALLSMDWKGVASHGEFYALLIFSTFGMNLMASSANLVMLFLSIEMASIPLYVMAGFMSLDNKSTEAGLKYLLFGAMTSAVMLYGFSLMYGFAGTSDLYALADAMRLLLMRFLRLA